MSNSRRTRRWRKPKNLLCFHYITKRDPPQPGSKDIVFHTACGYVLKNEPFEHWSHKDYPIEDAVVCGFCEQALANSVQETVAAAPTVLGHKGEDSMNSLNAVKGGGRIGAKVARSSLVIGDLFKNSKDGKTYMHTGNRTRPPSGGHTTVELRVNGALVSAPRVDNFKTIRTVGGKEVIAFQSIVVKPNARGEGVKAGEDGAVVTFEDSQVIYCGRAEINLPA